MMSVITSTGWPFSMVGRYFHCSTASRAALTSSGCPRTRLRFSMLPSLLMVRGTRPYPERAPTSRAADKRAGPCGSDSPPPRGHRSAPGPTGAFLAGGGRRWRRRTDTTDNAADDATGRTGITDATNYAGTHIGRRRGFHDLVDRFRDDFRSHQLVGDELAHHRLWLHLGQPAEVGAVAEAVAGAEPPACSSAGRSASASRINQRNQDQDADQRQSARCNDTRMVYGFLVFCVPSTNVWSNM